MGGKMMAGESPGVSPWKKRRIGVKALISACNKDGITALAGFLHEAGWEILSTGGAIRYLKEHNLPTAGADGCVR
jgi:hypothetical protein